MRRDPFGGRHRQQPGAGRRGINPRFIILLLFAGYGVYYWFSNQSVDAVTGESVLIDRSLSIEDEKAAWSERAAEAADRAARTRSARAAERRRASWSSASIRNQYARERTACNHASGRALPLRTATPPR